MGLGKEKRMFTAIRSSYLYLESLKNAALDYEKEWGFSFVYSDQNKLEGNAVVMDVGLSQGQERTTGYIDFEPLILCGCTWQAVFFCRYKPDW